MTLFVPSTTSKSVISYFVSSLISFFLMGSSLSRAIRSFVTRNDRRCLLVGLDNAGKTTVCKGLSNEVTTTTIPTVGFNVETIKVGTLTLKIWDVGGQDSLRPYWRYGELYEFNSIHKV